MSSTFPPVYQSIERRTLLETYAAGPERLAAALEGLTESDLQQHPIPGKWSIIEIVHHLCDSELIGAGRLRFLVAQPGSTLAVYSEDTWATQLSYQDRADELEAVVNLFTAVRTMSLKLMLRQQADGWSRVAVHPSFGPVTLRNLLELYADHSERHIDQILQRRRLLGCPAELEPTLLPIRLY